MVAWLVALWRRWSRTDDYMTAQWMSERRRDYDKAGVDGPRWMFPLDPTKR